jgi:hypothetical protein
MGLELRGGALSGAGAGRRRGGVRRAVAIVIAMGLKLAFAAAAIATPLLGVWVASSLSSYSNGATWAVVLAGLFFFPLGPIAWEALAARRSRKRHPGRRHVLTGFDRLLLRTLALNLALIAVLVAALPDRTFLALSTRGDWMLDGWSGATADRVRGGLFAAAGAFEGLYLAVRDENPYRSESAREAPRPEPVARSEPGRARWPLPAVPHRLIAAVPAEAEASIEALGRWIAGREPDPVQRAKAIHDWIVDRIAYDVPAFLSGDIPPEDGEALSVFRRRKGVCAGYSRLFAALAGAAGLEAAYIVGDARMKGQGIESMGHAWNAVKLHGRWYLVDTTWDIGGLVGDRIERRYGTEYLFTPPEVFGLDHLPDDPTWQLRADPIDRGEFLRQPRMRPSFYALGLELIAPTRSQVTVDGALDIEVARPAGIEVLATIGDTRCQVTGERRATLRCTVPSSGEWEVVLYAGPEGATSFEGVGEFAVNRR